MTAASSPSVSTPNILTHAHPTSLEAAGKLPNRFDVLRPSVGSRHRDIICHTQTLAAPGTPRSPDATAVPSKISRPRPQC
jgi:hypothetical protein